ncbi:MAG: hypothetical protein GVY10_07870, partial [Verrucomicrobia bacterium]|nr:hypothetical protein [Verrucomicrobiota bacterium]
MGANLWESRLLASSHRHPGIAFAESGPLLVSMAFQPSMPSLLGLLPDELAASLEAAGYRRFRAGQVLEWLYRKRVGSFAEMTNLPKSLRAWLEKTYALFPSSLLLVKQAGDITEKLLLKGEDGRLVETVLIRYPQSGVGLDTSRRTLCVSSQVGCAYGCRFCASGLAGFKRDLTAAEIVAQFLHIARLEEGRDPDAGGGDRVPFDNIVFM